MTLLLLWKQLKSPLKKNLLAMLLILTINYLQVGEVGDDFFKAVGQSYLITQLIFLVIYKKETFPFLKTLALVLYKGFSRLLRNRVAKMTSPAVVTPAAAITNEFSLWGTNTMTASEVAHYLTKIVFSFRSEPSALLAIDYLAKKLNTKNDHLPRILLLKAHALASPMDQSFLLKFMLQGDDCLRKSMPKEKLFLILRQWIKQRGSKQAFCDLLNTARFVEWFHARKNGVGAYHTWRDILQHLHYLQINLEMDLDEKILKKAYNAMALKYHPDRAIYGINVHEAQQRFQQVNTSYQELKKHIVSVRSFKSDFILELKRRGLTVQAEMQKAFENTATLQVAI